MTETGHGGVNWMLDELVDGAGADCAVALSADGIMIQKSAGIDRDHADQLAALASTMSGVNRETGRTFNRGQVRQLTTEWDRGWLLVTAAGPNALLAVLTGRDVDLGQVGFEMNLLADRVTEHLAAAQRNGASRP